jgi:hypothetical protein
MKTTTIIKALAYPVQLIDKRTGEHLTDTVVLEKSWLSICGKLDICDDKHLIYRIYNPRGYEVADIGKRRNVNLVVDLEQLYAIHAGSEVAGRG